MKVAVFSSCSAMVSPFLFHEIEALGLALARDGHQVIFGGSGGGCMGALARGVGAGGGHLIGVLPKVEGEEWVMHDGVHEVHHVENLSVRKQVMNDLADAFVIFPGGLGTLDEAFTVLTLKSLGKFPKPIVLYNFMDIWSPLLEALELLVTQRLIRCPLAELFVVLDEVQPVRAYLGAGV